MTTADKPLSDTENAIFQEIVNATSMRITPYAEKNILKAIRKNTAALEGQLAEAKAKSVELLRHKNNALEDLAKYGPPAFLQGGDRVHILREEYESLRAENTELRERVKALEPVRWRTCTIPVLPHNYPNTFEGYGVDDAELVAVVKHDNGQVFAYFKERIDTPPEDTP